MPIGSRRISCAILTSMALFTQASLAATPSPTALACPASIQLSSAHLEASGLPTGTTLSVDRTPLPLSGSNVFSGPPEQAGALMPTATTKGKGGNRAVWEFEGSYPEGKFISCDYAGGTVRVVRRVDDAAKRCTSTSSTTKNPPALQTQFQCE
ncbi:STY0301 family protein [Paracidovorax konjaci]|uniref:Uncharacterized protein n=1 Tax=Paracidovorax konjaci TaxID=32040 RepID=A0A1I1V1B1_9BURK|nr:STY0301 family protein [Paracidovorax konjaci]SFD74883.1 hypothetical protein SAMN04489710_105329 [Paracidovorax konjaci]